MAFIKNRFNDDTHSWKEIDIAKLAKILKASGGKTVCVNKVSNLLVFDAQGREIGYVDMLKEEFVKIS